MNDIEYLIWFSRLKINNLEKLNLLKRYNHPKNIYNLNKKEIEKNIVNKNIIQEVFNISYRKDLERLYKDMVNKKIKIINYFSEEYPECLKNIYSPPVILFYIGNINLLKKRSIAIVGARMCSEYGKNVAKEIAGNLALDGIVVVSGLAKGIDKYSHIGCLEKNGKTIAVLGSGIDIIYPIENKKLYYDIINNDGLIISEYFLGAKPEGKNFPERNRIISGISDGVIVVEATEKSGSFITVDYALEQGKDVYAVPGNITSPYSKRNK